MVVLERLFQRIAVRFLVQVSSKQLEWEKVLRGSELTSVVGFIGIVTSILLVSILLISVLLTLTLGWTIVSRWNPTGAIHRCHSTLAAPSAVDASRFSISKGTS